MAGEKQHFVVVEDAGVVTLFGPFQTQAEAETYLQRLEDVGAASGSKTVQTAEKLEL